MRPFPHPKGILRFCDTCTCHTLANDQHIRECLTQPSIDGMEEWIGTQCWMGSNLPNVFFLVTNRRTHTNSSSVQYNEPVDRVSQIAHRLKQTIILLFFALHFTKR